jgi:uncharacterized LabA/DUF88 family protein
MASEIPSRRVYMYVDGFNFYHASLENPAVYPYGWCNWKDTAQNYCGPNATVAKVKYFTSLVRDARKVARQTLHIKAMETIAEVIYGEFATRGNKRCSQCGRVLSCGNCGSAEHTVEKKTDVNIAVHMLRDAVNHMYTEALLVTADRDLLPVVEAVLDRQQFPDPLRVTVLFPPGARFNTEFLERERMLRGLRCIELSTARMVRFPEELARRWNFRFPQHWRIREEPSAALVSRFGTEGARRGRWGLGQ